MMVTGNGFRPKWSLDGSAIYVQRGGYPSASLVKIELDLTALEISNQGRPIVKSQTVLAESKYATEIQVSPSEREVAFIEFNGLYLAPFEISRHDDGAAAMQVTARSGLQPNGLRRIAQDGVHSIDWSHDVTSFTWLRASSLFRATDSAAILKCHETDSGCIGSHIVEYDLSFQVDGDVPQDDFVCFDNVTVATMRTSAEEFINEARIVVSGDRIQDVRTK
jgi:hypothetical protein